MVNDGAVLRVIDDVHGDELGAEGHHVEFGSHRLVRVHHRWDGLSLHPPPRELKHGRAVLRRRHGCKAGRRGLKDQGRCSSGMPPKNSGTLMPVLFKSLNQNQRGLSLFVFN